MRCTKFFAVYFILFTITTQFCFRSANAATQLNKNIGDAVPCAANKIAEAATILELMQVKKSCTDAYKARQTPETTYKLGLVATQFAWYEYKNHQFVDNEYLKVAQLFLSNSQKLGIDTAEAMKDLGKVNRLVGDYKNNGGVFTKRGTDNSPSGHCIWDEIPSPIDRSLVLSKANACREANNENPSIIASANYAHTQLLLAAVDYQQGDKNGARIVREANATIRETISAGWIVEPELKKLGADLANAYEHNLKVLNSNRTLTASDVAIGSAVVFQILKYFANSGFTSAGPARCEGCEQQRALEDYQKMWGVKP